MAMTADSSQSPRSGSGSGSGSVLSVDGVNSPQKHKSLHSPWAQIVRGEPESVPPLNHSPPPPPLPSFSPPSILTSNEQSTFSDCSPENFESNAEKPKKLAWKKPSNGVAEVVSPVMGAVSWPALSESTKSSPKSSSADSSDGSIANNQVPVMPPKQTSSNAKSNATSNQSMPARQRPIKRGGGGGGGTTSGGGHSHSHSQSNFTHAPPPPPPPPPFPLFAMPPNGYGNMVPAMPDRSPRDPPYRGNNNWEPRPVGGFVTQPPAVNDHRHSSRRGNFGPRGDGTYHHNFGGRRDQDRGHYGNVRDAPVQQQRSPRGFVRPPPPNTTTFVPPQPVRPFANPIGFPDVVYIPTLPLEPFRGVPFITHAPAPGIIVPVPEPPLPAMLVHQIEYYFSDANLIKDDFLKSNMDDQGWVSITLIAGFNRVKSMTKDIQLILDSLRASTVLEVQEEKVRRRNDWMKWIPGSSRLSTDSGLQSFNSPSQGMLTNSFQKMTVEEVTSNQISTQANPLPNPEDISIRSSSELMTRSQVSKLEGIEDSSSS